MADDKKQELEPKDVVKPMVSMAKMDITELKAFTSRLSEYLKEPELVAIRICECCVDINIT